MIKTCDITFWLQPLSIIIFCIPRSPGYGQSSFRARCSYNIASSVAKMRPTIAVRLLLTVSAVLILCVLFLSLLKELLREMKASDSEKRTFLAASWFTTEAVDSETPASFSPAEAFSWKGIDKNVVEVKELQGGRWKVKYQAKSVENDEGDQEGEAVGEDKADEGALKNVGRRIPVGGGSRHEGEDQAHVMRRQGSLRSREMPGGLVRRRPPARTLEAKEEFELKEEFEPKEELTSPRTPHTMTEPEIGGQEASEAVRAEPFALEQSPRQEQNLDTMRILQMEKDEPETQTAPPAGSYGSNHLYSQQQLDLTATYSTVPPSLSNITHSERDFSIKSYLSVPHPSFTQKAVLQESWVRELQKFLRTLQSQQVSVVTANEDHSVVVLNWLISAVVVSNFSLENTLVLSLSPNLAKLLHSKGIPTIFVEPRSVIADSARNIVRTGFSQVHIVRLTFFRLINHWGYDLVWYDSDAVVLKNPQPLFDKYPDAGLVGSAGKGPTSLGGVWGRTICTGVLLMRSSHNMGEIVALLPGRVGAKL